MFVSALFTFLTPVQAQAQVQLEFPAQDDYFVDVVVVISAALETDTKQCVTRFVKADRQQREIEHNGKSFVRWSVKDKKMPLFTVSSD
jgi:hypothetical protein